MSRLQELLLKQGLATVSELNRAIFSYPDSGVLDAIEQTFGLERAQHARRKVAEHLEIDFVLDEKVEIGVATAEVRAIDFIPLIVRFKALPIGWDEREGEKRLLVAFSDPVNTEAQIAFQNLFGVRIKPCLAREKAILDAYAISAAELSIAARGEMATHPDAHLGGVAKHAEDPEVRKAIQQLIATAVKHNASLVEIDPNRPFTRAQFTFADGMSSAVEISVSPIAVIASLLRRGQIHESGKDRVEVECRIRFKSVSVNFTTECIQFPSGVDRRVLVRDFIIDSPDNPCFWGGLYSANSALLRELFERSNGVFFLQSQRAASAEFASRAIVESYPDTSLVEIAPPFSETHPLWRQAGERRVLALVRGGDSFDLLPHLAKLSAKNKSLIRGIFSYHQLPRVCVFCTEPSVPETGELLKIPSEISLTKKEFHRGKGCEICEDRGVLGFVGVSSVFDAEGYAGKLLRSGADLTALYDGLTKDCFEPVLEDGVRSAGSGLAPLNSVFDELPLPPALYLEKRGFSTEHSSKIIEVEEPLDLKLADDDFEEKREADSKVVKSPTPLDPIRGREAFLTRPQSGEARVVEENWIMQKSAGKEESGAQKKKSGEQRQSLLVIDDDADQRSILRRVFEIAGYDVEVAADGIDGIISATRLEPSLIIVDFMMPELDGRETIRRLKSGPTTKGIPVVALTAYADPDVELGLLQAGADDFCPKSVSKQVLLKRVERLVRAAKAIE